MSTKQKILERATELFNRHGYGPVSLNELARYVGISRGNLTYHFPDKDDLLEAIANTMWNAIEVEKAKSRQFPSFENLHNDALILYQFQSEYRFIFLDSHVLNHPAVNHKIQQITRQMILDNEAAIAYAVSVGNMKDESVPGLYHNLAFLSWMTYFFWLTQQSIGGISREKTPEKIIWSLLLPHFTDKGKKSFIKYFGQDYYNSLGPRFTDKIDRIISL